MKVWEGFIFMEIFWPFLCGIVLHSVGRYVRNLWVTATCLARVGCCRLSSLCWTMSNVIVSLLFLPNVLFHRGMVMFGCAIPIPAHFNDMASPNDQIRCHSYVGSCSL